MEYVQNEDGEIDDDSDNSRSSGEHRLRKPPKYSSEAKLIKSLYKEPNYHKSENVYSQIGKSDILKGLVDLKQFRTRVNQEDEREVDISLVRGLDDPLKNIPESSTGFSKIKRLNERRENDHNAALESYENENKLLSSNFERDVIEVCKILQNNIDNSDISLANFWVDINDDNFIRMIEYKDMLSHHDTLNHLLRTRKDHIISSINNLDKIENDRQKYVSQNLEYLISSLNKIGFMVSEEIHRIAEEKGEVSNVTVLNNLKEILELRTNFLKDQLALEITNQDQFTKRIVDWRQLKHNYTIQIYRNNIDDNDIKFPVTLKTIIDKLNYDLYQIHNNRQEILKKLFDLQVTDITIDNIRNIQNLLTELSEKDDRLSENTFGLIQNNINSRKNRINELKEDFRKDIHKYGALITEPDFRQYQQQLIKILDTPEMIDNLRKYGNLGKELNKISTELLSPSLIYNDDITNLMKLLDMILNCIDINGLLDNKGLLSVKLSCLSTLEKIRTCKKHDIPPLIPVLIKQAKDIESCNELPDLFFKELCDCTVNIGILDEAMRSIPFAGGNKNDNSSVHSGSKSFKSGFSRRTSFTRTSMTRTSYTRSSKTSSNTVISENIKLANNLDISEFRNNTRRLTFILSCSELPDTLKQLLVDIRKSLETQKEANNMVDEVIAREYDHLIQKRHDEFEKFYRTFGVLLQSLTGGIHEKIALIGNFFSHLAILRYEHLEERLKLELSFDDKLTSQLDEYDFDLHNNMNKLDELKLKIMNSSTLDEATKSYDECVEHLKSIDNFYRVTNSKYIDICNNYPVDTLEQLDNYQSTIELIFKVIYKDRDIPPEFLPKVEAPIIYEDIQTNKGGKKLEIPEITIEPPQPETLFTKEFIHDREFYILVDPLEFTKLTIDSSYQKELDKKKEMERLRIQKEKEEAERLEAEKKSKKPSKPTSKDVLPPEEVIPPPEPLIEKSLKDELSEFVDVTGRCIINFYQLNIEEICSELIKLRNNVIKLSYDEIESRVHKSQDICDFKKKDYTHQLEVLLREHWPIKGEIQMSVLEIRINQLISHNQIYQRFVKNLVSKNSAHENEFLDNLKNLRNDFDHFNYKLQLLFPDIPNKQNLGELSGIESTGHQLRDSLIKSKKSSELLFELSINSQPNSLKKAKEDFIKQCLLFGRGGDYVQAEIDFIEEGLNSWITGLDDIVNERKELINNIYEQITDVLDKFKLFDEEILKRNLDICIRDGLGLKYGRPRRNFLEKCKCELIKSEKMQNTIDDLLNEIDKEINQNKITKGPLSLDIIQNIVTLRSRIIERALYLDILKNKNAISITKVPITDDPIRDTSNQSVYPQVDYQQPEYTFMDFYTKQVSEIKDNTKLLYKQANRENSLPQSGVPETLQIFLNDNQTKMVNYKDEASLYYREQLNKLSEYCQLIPNSLFNNILERWKNDIENITKTNKEVYQNYYHSSEIHRNTNINKLRPNLKSRNFSTELELLLKDEEDRNNNDKEQINKSLHDICKSIVEKSYEYLHRIIQYSKILMHLYDTILYYIDIMPLKGDENIIPTPKSIKKLIRMKEKLDNGTLERPDRFRRKDWKGIPFSLLVLPENVKVLVEQYKEINVDLFIANETIQNTKKNDKAQPPKANQKNQPKVIETTESESSKINSFVTQGHRSCYHIRNDIYKEFIDNFNQLLMNVINYYQDESSKSDKWKNDWTKSVNDLKDGGN